MNPKKSFEPGLSRPLLTAICGCFLTVIPANAQISVVNTVNNLFSNSNLTTYTFSFNAGASANKLIVSAGTESPAAISSITYNGVALTLIPNTGNAASGRNRGIWYLDNPHTGSAANIVVTGAASLNHMRLGVVSISGSAPGAAIGNVASTASVSLNVPVADSFVLAASASNHDASEPGIGVSAPLTSIFTTGGDSARHAAGYQNSVAAGTVTYSFTNPTQPETSAAAFVPASASPVIISTAPVDNTPAVAIGANLVATFSEPVLAGTGNIELRHASGSLVESFNAASSSRLTFSGSTLTIDPTAALTPGVGYYVLIAPTAVLDTNTNAFAGISDPTAWNFTAAFYDDFNDGNDDGWARQSPLAGFGAPAVFSFPGGNSYQISSPVSPNPGLFGPARAGSLRLDESYAAYFQQSVDIVDWDNSQSGTTFGMLARVSDLGLGTLDGYSFTVTLGGTLEILRITNEAPVSPPVASASIGALSTANDYRLVFTGDGSTLTGQIFNLANLSTPIATISGIDATYASGNSGLIITSSSDTQAATATFDNYSSAPFGTPIAKANNSNNLNLGSSWAGGVPPTSTDRAKWDSTVTSANTTSLAANLSFGGIVIANPTGPVTINPGNTLSLGAGLVDIDLSAATQDLTLNCALSMEAPNVWDVTSGRTLALGGVISGSAGVTKQGAGTAILSNANGYTGGTAITAGTLKLSGSGTLGAAGASVAVSSGALLDLNGSNQSIAFTAGTGAGTVANNSGSGTSTLTLSANPLGNIVIADNTNSSTGKVAVVVPVNCQNLSASNSYSGGTTVNAGAFLYNNPGGSGTGMITLTALGANGAASSGLVVNGGIYANDLTGAGYVHNNSNSGATVITTTFTGNINTTGPFIFRAGTGITYNFAGDGTSSSLSGVIGSTTSMVNGAVATGRIIKSGTGTLTLSGNNLYTGTTTVSGGTLALHGGSQKSPITVQTDATLGFDITAPTSSTASVTLNVGHKISVTGSPTEPSYTLLTTSSTINVTEPNLDPAIPGYELMVDGGNTLKLVATSGDTFADWISDPAFGLAPADQDLDDDPDGDGIDNGAENFFGTNPGTFTQGLLVGTKSGNTFTFTHPQNATPASDLTASYKWSKDLASFLASGVPDGAGTTVTFTTQANFPSPGITTVTASVTGTATSKLFVRVIVTHP